MEQSIDDPNKNDEVPLASTEKNLEKFKRDIYRRSLDRRTYMRLQNVNHVKVGAKNNISDLKRLFENNGNKNSEIPNANIDKGKSVINQQTAFTPKESNNNVDKQTPFASHRDNERETNEITSAVNATIDDRKREVVNNCEQIVTINQSVTQEEITSEEIPNDTTAVEVNVPSKTVSSFDVVKRTSGNIEKLQSNLKKSYFEDSPVELRKTSSIRKDSPRSSQKRVSFSSDVSKIPIPAPRKSLLAKEKARETRPIEVVTVEVINIEKEVVTPVVLPPSRKKYDVNSNYLKKPKTKKKHSGLNLDEIQFAAPEEKHIIERASSEDSIDKIEASLGAFVMDDRKEKKRSNSFTRILRGTFSRKDKKKDEEKKKHNKPENEVAVDNAQNESFNRNSALRHTTDVRGRQNVPPEGTNQLEKRYAELYINSFEQKKANFQRLSGDSKFSEDYVCMDNRTSGPVNPRSYTIPASVNKYIDTSSSSNTIDSENIGFDRIRDSDTSNYSNPPEKVLNTNVALRNKFFERSYAEIPEKFFDTPPRAYDPYQNVQLVKPKANIPISSERPLPLPYQEKEQEPKTIERNLNSSSFKEMPNKRNVVINKNEFNDGIYGTVYDRKFITNRTKPPSPDFRSQSSDGSLHSVNLGSRSPSLEGSKLKLPANREKIDLQPRIKSPIPQNVISTDKIIATELLKSKNQKKDDKRTSPSHQRLEIEIDYPDNSFLRQKNMDVLNNSLEGITMRKPPISPQSKITQSIEAGEWHRKQRELSESPSLYPQNAQVVTNVLVHVEPQLIPKNPPMTPTQDLRSRSTTPVTMRSPSSTTSLQRTPPKQEIRQNVEAFCWKELKKLKEQEDKQIQMQIQLSNYGYAEDPGIGHRSRSMSPAFARNTRRSSSLPREVERQRRMNDVDASRRGNHQNVGPQNVYYASNRNFVRNSPQRSTVGSTNVSYETNDARHRPIFRRGSLTQHFIAAEPQYSYNKKVSFHSPQNLENPNSWPTKNGYTQSPPQRRLDIKRECSLEDEVFLPDPRKFPPDERDVLRKEPIYSTKPPIYNQTQNIQRPTREDIFYNQQRLKQMREQEMRSSINEPIYDFRPLPNERIYGVKQEVLYGTRSHDPRVQTREPIYATRAMPNISEESIYAIRRNPQEPIYVTKQHQQRATSVSRYDYPSDEPQMVPQKKLYHNQYNQNGGEPIYNQKPFDNPIYDTRQNVQDQMYGRVGGPKITTVNNRVCDMYGKIHDSPRITSPSPAQTSGVLYGQLQRNSNAAPVQYQSYNQLRNTNFVRGTRLTASVNDMHRHNQPAPRYRQEIYEPPDRPLPPVPNGNRSKFPFARRQPQPNTSDTESNASEVQRIFQNREHAAKNRGIVGK